MSAGVGASVGGSSGGSTGGAPDDTAASDQTPDATPVARTGSQGPSLIGRPMVTRNGVRIGEIVRVERNLVCAPSACVRLKTRPTLTREGLVVNIHSSDLPG